MLRIKSIMLLFGIVMCFFNSHNAMSETIDMKSKNDFKFYPFGHKFRNISNNLKTSCILDNVFPLPFKSQILYSDGFICNMFSKYFVYPLSYITHYFKLLFFDSLALCFVYGFNRYLYEIMLHRELFVDFLKPLLMQKKEYIWFSCGNFKVLYRYLSLDGGYCFVKARMDFSNFVEGRWFVGKLFKKSIDKNTKGTNTNNEYYFQYESNGEQKRLYNIDVDSRCPICYHTLNEIIDAKGKGHDMVFHFSQLKRDKIIEKINNNRKKKKDEEILENKLQKIDSVVTYENLESILNDRECIPCSHFTCSGCFRDSLIGYYSLGDIKIDKKYPKNYLSVPCVLCNGAGGRKMKKPLMFNPDDDLTYLARFFYISFLQQLTVEYSNYNKIYTYMTFLRVSVIVEPVCYINSFLLPYCFDPLKVTDEEYLKLSFFVLVNDKKDSEINNSDINDIFGKYLSKIDDSNRNTMYQLPEGLGLASYEMYKRYEYLKKRYNNRRDNQMAHEDDIVKVPQIFCVFNLALKIEGGVSYKNYYFLSIYFQPTIILPIKPLENLYNSNVENIYLEFDCLELSMKNLYIKIGIDFFINNRDDNFLNIYD